MVFARSSSCLPGTSVQSIPFRRTADQNRTLRHDIDYTWYFLSERDIASKHTAQHLCTNSSWHYQIASCTKSWVSYVCPLHILLYILPLREHGVRRQPLLHDLRRYHVNITVQITYLLL